MYDEKCKVCGGNELGPPTGIYYRDHAPAAVGFDCPCGNSRAFPWDKVDEETRRQAILAEKARMAVNGWL